MKAKFDFGYVRKEERDIIKSILNAFFDDDINFLNTRVSYNPKKERVVFKINNYYFSIAFNDKISFEDEVKFINTLSLFNKNQINIKKIPDFTHVFPIFEQVCSLNGREFYFSSSNDILDLEKEILENDFIKLHEKKVRKEKNIKLSIKPIFIIKCYQKINQKTYQFNYCNYKVLFNFEYLNTKYVVCDFEVNDNKMIFTLSNEYIENYKKELFMDNQNIIDIKGELYIGSIDIDIKSLLSLKAGDKIILDKEDKIPGILKIGSKEILIGDINFDEKNINFTITSSNF